MNKREDTEKRILDAAIEMFWSESYHGVNMNALSAAAGVNKTTVYQYFGSKEELAIAAVVHKAADTRARVYQATFDQIKDPRQRLASIFEKAYGAHSKYHQAVGKCRGCPFVNLGVELATTSEGMREAITDVFSSFQGYYHEIAEDFYAERGADGVPDKNMAEALMATMNGSLVAAKLENRPEALLDGQKRALHLLNM